jgi:segregation and condensation protein B
MRSGSRKENKRLVEALLFISPSGLSIEEIAKRARISRAGVRKAIEGLRKEYKGKGVEIVKEGDLWRMIVAREFASKVKEFAPMELRKSILKTLAVIAWKAPVKQSWVVKIRGNKAYDHVKELLRRKLIKAKPHKRTLILSLAKGFYDYFYLKRGEEKYLLGEG